MRRKTTKLVDGEVFSCYDVIKDYMETIGLNRTRIAILKTVLLDIIARRGLLSWKLSFSYLMVSFFKGDKLYEMLYLRRGNKCEK